MYTIRWTADKLQMYVMQPITLRRRGNIDMSCQERGNTLDCLLETEYVLGTYKWQHLYALYIHTMPWARSPGVRLPPCCKHEVTNPLMLTMAISTAMLSRHCRRSAALSEHYAPPTCARRVSLDSQLHWPSKDAIWAQIEGTYAHLPLNLESCS